MATKPDSKSLPQTASGRLSQNRWSGWLPLGLLLLLTMRVGLGATAFFAQILIPVLSRAGTAPYFPPSLDRWSERLLGVWSHWDGEWFLHIATNGYDPNDGSLAFFPLYPLLVKIMGLLCLGNYLLAGVLVSSGATLAVFVLLYQLCLYEWSREIAGRTCFYLLVFPFAFFLAAIYSEALFLALTLGAFWCARHLRYWWWAGLLAAAATLTRSTGILLVVPLTWEWWQYQRSGLQLNIKRGGWRLNLSWLTQSQAWQKLVAVLVLPLLALVGWIVFNWQLSGDPLGFFKAQASWVWNRHSQAPWEAVWRGADLFFKQVGAAAEPASGKVADPNLWEFPVFVLTAVVFAIATWWVWRRKFALSYVLYFGLALVLPLTSPSNKEPLLSFPRFALVLFPIFMVLALLGQRWQWFHYLYVYGGLLLSGLFFARFANWYWVA